MKAGDKCITPHGEGTIVHFEVYPPLGRATHVGPALHREPEFWDEADPNIPEGWFVRAGVMGYHPMLDVAYYPLDQISPPTINQTPPWATDPTST